MLLLDAGVWVASVAPEEPHHREAAELVVARDRELGALDLTLYEVANVVGAKRRQLRDAERLARLILRRCGERVATVDASLIGGAVDIASEHGISAYDAAYVIVARRNGWQLVSTDLRDLVSRGLAVTPDAALYP